ncbi:MAG: hypothetical protein ACYC7D_08710 [Nitrososphaerales archaeon]
MPSRIITVSVNADVEQKFRKIAKAVHGKKRGYLGKALTEAMEKWTKEKQETGTVAETLGMLESGLDLGGIKYRHRNELHER